MSLQAERYRKSHKKDREVIKSCWHKIRYRTNEEAKEALFKIKYERARHSQIGQENYRRECRYYECVCRGFHLTSRAKWVCD